MKKFIWIILTLFLSLNVVFGFEISDHLGESREYFSSVNDLVFVNSVQDESPLTIKVVGDDSSLRSFNFISCGGDFCYNFSLSSYMLDVGLSLESNEFLISSGISSKVIYYDVDFPEFDLQNSVIDSDSKLLKLYFSFQDNLNVESVEIFNVLNSGVSSLGIVDSNSFDFPLVSEGTVNLMFRVIDGAGNFKDFDFSFNISDLYSPIVSDIFLVKESNLFTFEFTAEDSNLKNYELVQNDLRLDGDLSGAKVSKSVIIPFTYGKMNLNVYDSFGNVNSKVISLSSDFDIEFESRYSNDDEFRFEANADLCKMISIDSKQFNDKFSNKKDDFYIDLDLSVDGVYNLEFYCEDNGFRETFTRDFIYDTKLPLVSNLSLESDDDGFIKLFWDDSSDDISDVSYKLYRDSDSIYSGSRNFFIDEDVSYLETYNYYLVIMDEAGNKVESELVSGVSKKVSIELKTSLDGDIEVSDSKFRFDVVSELDSETLVVVKNLGKEFYSKDINEVKKTVKLDLVSGVNEIIVSSVDEFSNKKFLRYFVTYNLPIPDVPEPVFDDEIISKNVVDGSLELSDKISGGVVTNEIVKPEIKNEINSKSDLVVDDKVNSNSLNDWIFFGLFILVLILFVYIFIFNERKLNFKLKEDKFKFDNFNFGGGVDRNKKHHKGKHVSTGKKDNHDFKRQNDLALHKHIGKIKKERISKHQEKLAAERKAKFDAMKPKRKVSELDRKKISDLKNKKFNFDISHKYSNDNYKMKSEPILEENALENDEVFKEESTYNNKNMKIKLKKNPGFFGLFKRAEKSEPSEEDIANDEFIGYIGNQRNKKAWDNPKLYRQSHYDELEAKKLEKLKAIEDQKRMELQAKQLEIDEHNKKLAKKAKAEAEKQEFNNNRKIARATMDEYLSSKSKKRSSWFAEKLVEKDIKFRK